jgi:CRP/FNR family transcriptional regulator, nitrogen fixation regulation protein
MHIQHGFSRGSVKARGGLAGALPAAAATFYPADTAIYAQGDKSGALYLVEFGTVRICSVTADGRRQISAFHMAGEVFGFASGAEHETYAESVDGAGIRLVRQQAGLADPNILNLALQGLGRAQNHLLLLGRRTAAEKLAVFFTDVMERQGDDRHVRLAMPRNDIADYLGLTFETVSRLIRSFKDQGVIRLKSVHEVEILDPARLEDMCA